MPRGTRRSEARQRKTADDRCTRRTNSQQAAPRARPVRVIGIAIPALGCTATESDAIGVNSSAFGYKFTLFNAIPLSRFSLKMSRFFGVFRVRKNAPLALFSASSGTQKLGNQLPVVGKAKICSAKLQNVVCFACL